MRKCPKCLRELPATNEYFYRKKHQNAVGLDNWCKRCRSAQQAEYRKQYFSDDERRLRSALRDTRSGHGCSYEEYKRLEAKQKGKCAVCKKPPRGSKFNERRLHVDHCHRTGFIRGLLCIKCNVALGLLEDNPRLLKSALRYLGAQDADV